MSISYQLKNVSITQLYQPDKPLKLESFSIEEADFYKVLVMDKIFHPITCKSMTELRIQIARLTMMGAKKFRIDSYKQTETRTVFTSVTS